MGKIIDIKMPTKAEFRRMHLKNYLRFKKDKTMLSYWYPKIEYYNSVQSLTYHMIPMPETHIIRLGYDDILDEKPTRLYKLNLQRVKDACKKVGYPCFLKTDMFSGKHSWKDTCFITSEDEIERHIYTLTEDAEIVGCTPALNIIVRELIQTKPLFYAFWGEMPIVTERRYFVQNGKVIFHHPYWPPATIEAPSTPDWRKILDKDNIESNEEITELIEKTQTVGRILGDSWSVDWLKDKHGNWWLTDMAEMDKSYRWDDYELGIVGLK